MIRHLLVLTWNRRRTNLLLLIELFVAFLVLISLTTLGFWGWRAYHEDPGYSIDGVWRVRVSAGESYLHDAPKRFGSRWVSTPRPVLSAQGPLPSSRRLMDAMRALPPVVAVAAMQGATPYGGSRGGRWTRIAGREFRFGIASDDLPAVLSIALTRGRWFGREDDGGEYLPVVINERLAREQFGQADPLGKTLVVDPKVSDDSEDAATAFRPTMRVVGTLRDYLPRKPFKGDYGGRPGFMFQRLPLDRPDDKDPPTFLVKVRAGTPAAFEQALLRAVQNEARGFAIDIAAYEQGRRQMLDQALGFFTALGVLGGFLLVLVAFGLLGVVWQNVTLRTAEIGLRRAQGATAGDIRRQFLGELLALATVAMAAAGVVVLHFGGIAANLSYFDVGWVTWDVYAVGFAFSALAIYGLVMFAGFLPAQLASRVQPLQALRQE